MLFAELVFKAGTQCSPLPWCPHRISQLCNSHVYCACRVRVWGSPQDSDVRSAAIDTLPATPTSLAGPRRARCHASMPRVRPAAPRVCPAPPVARPAPPVARPAVWGSHEGSDIGPTKEIVAPGQDPVARKEAQCAEVHQPRGVAAGNGAQQLQGGKRRREEDVAESLPVSSADGLTDTALMQPCTVIDCTKTGAGVPSILDRCSKPEHRHHQRHGSRISFIMCVASASIACVWCVFGHHQKARMCSMQIGWPLN
jgi:hypothetical protein